MQQPRSSPSDAVCSSWGMRGAFWPVLNRVVVGCIWMGKRFDITIPPGRLSVEEELTLVRYSDVLGRTGGSNHARRSHWAKIREHGEYSTSFC
jgi:hypothetical protein